MTSPLLNGETSNSSIHGPLCGGLGVAIGISISAGASGGHLNPGVTVAHAVLGKERLLIIGDNFFILLFFNYFIKNKPREDWFWCCS